MFLHAPIGMAAIGHRELDKFLCELDISFSVTNESPCNSINRYLDDCIEVRLG